MARDYKATVFLPKTDFPMKAGLPKLEPTSADRWQEARPLPAAPREAKGRTSSFLHDGPHKPTATSISAPPLNKI